MIDQGLTVGAAAAAVGVTVRSLHHWEQRGLVQPSMRTAAGYRVYGAADIARIQRICLYRELGIPLDEIARLLDDPATAPAESLQRQREQLAEQLERLQTMLTGVDRMLLAHRSGILLTAQQQVAVFGPQWQPEWIDGARERWGDTTQWAEYAERSAGRSASQWQEVADRAAALEADLVTALQTGVAAGSPEADALAERHRAGLDEYFSCTREMQVCLARGYQEDPGFTEHYEGLAPGLTVWLRSVVDANARAHGLDPDTATWS